MKQKLAAMMITGASVSGLLIGFAGTVHADEAPDPVATWIDGGILEDGAPIAESERARITCDQWVSGYTGKSKCSGGAGTGARQQRAKVTCIKPSGGKFVIYGNWVGYGGHVSSATCSPHGEAGVYKVETDSRTHG
ncbi:hypothetical protein AB0I84_39570 [Streptomyces spectabilis]|uniref:hypothetical protein n=1 Tax=Streptomyces spectabilis TaxID=68270 RepID=UPI0033EFB679